MLVAARFTLAVAVIPWPEMRGRITVVVKLSYEVQPDASVVLASRPDPLTPDTSSPTGVLLFPSDFVRSKSRCDVVIVGRALTLAPAPTTLKALSMTKAADHVAALGPISVRAAETPNVQHAAMDQRVPHPRLPFRLRYERESLSLDAIIPGPTPQVAIFRGKTLELQQPAVDTIAVDPERRRVMVSLRAIIDRVDLRETNMLVVDDLGGLPAAAAEIGSWKRSEAFVVTSSPPSAREPPATSRGRSPFAPPIDDEVTTAFSLRELEGEIEHTVTEMGQTPALAERSGETISVGPSSAFSGPDADPSTLGETAPLAPGPVGAARAIAKTVGMDRHNATTLPLAVARPTQETLPHLPTPSHAMPAAVPATLPPAPPTPKTLPPAPKTLPPTPTEPALPIQVAPPTRSIERPAGEAPRKRGHDADEVTSLDALANIAPALPFVSKAGRFATEPPPPSASPTQPPSEGAMEETVDGFGRETILGVNFPKSQPLPFSSGTQTPRPIPKGVQPATPFERPAVPEPPPTPAPAAPDLRSTGVPFAAPAHASAMAPPSAPTTSGTPFQPPPIAAATPFASVNRFNVGFDFKPVATTPVAARTGLSTPSMSLDLFAKIKAELWAKKESRRDVLKRHGVSELKWRMIERTLSDQLGERKADDQRVGGMLRDLASEVSKAVDAERPPAQEGR